MADESSSPSDRHRHAHRAAPGGRRGRLPLIAVGVLVVAVVAAVFIGSSRDRSDDAVAGQAVAPAPAPAASTTPAPTSPPAAPPGPTTGGTTPTPDVPVEFADGMQQIGIPLDPHTGWVVAQGICVRLGQPEYDEFKMSEGVERLFPSVPDEQAHEFVAMVAESVCHL
jgi:hypothetical protein